MVQVSAERLQFLLGKRNDTSFTVHLYAKEPQTGSPGDQFTIINCEAKLTKQREKEGECRSTLGLGWTRTKKSSRYATQLVKPSQHKPRRTAWLRRWKIPTLADAPNGSLTSISVSECPSICY